jgi:PAS domain S-box-containing protein
LTERTVTGRLGKIIRNQWFWLLLVLIFIITILYYAENLKGLAFLHQLTTGLGLTRHAFERVLYLVPISLAGFLFGWRGAFYTSLITLACMLPRVFLMSEYPTDALFETIAVFIIGNILAISFSYLRREREYRTRLETAQQELKSSEERYRKLFENAIDCIWVHDLEGHFISVNDAAIRMTGYAREELMKMNVKDFLSEDSLEVSRLVGDRLLRNEPVEQPYEQRVLRKDGTEAYIQFSTSLVFDKGVPVGFQDIARDITEHKRMDENLRFYLQLATRAQEEERKRISHELHDDTIQSLVVLSRQLDALSSDGKELPEQFRRGLEELWQQTNGILQGVRRLSQDLRPAAIDSLGLLPAIESLAAEVFKYSGTSTKVNVTGKERRLPEEVSVALFRIVQEALRNIWRHSGATEAQINIEFNDKSTRITVKDNGRGFKLSGNVGDLTKQGKLGLAGMQERAQLISGKLSVQSAPGKGTTITVEAPG